MNSALIKKAKEAIELGRKNGRVLDVSEAFKLYPVEEEVHEGKLEYFKNKENVKWSVKWVI